MSRRLIVLTFSLAIALTLLFARSTFAQIDPPGVDRTHYWTYHLEPPVIQPALVYAKDQFFLGYVPIQVDSLSRLVNWVLKNNSPVRDTFLHYTWWNINNKLPNHASAILRNQFGSFPIDVFDLDFMLVPAYKNYQSPVPPLANHYLCYKAQGPPPPPTGYDLRDEWRVDFQIPGPLQFLCVPCWKQHNGQIFPPVDTLTHLALYPIRPASERFAASLQDQFITTYELAHQEPVEYLLVPSLKDLIPTSDKRSTWGRIKQIYR